MKSKCNSSISNIHSLPCQRGANPTWSHSKLIIKCDNVSLKVILN